MGWYCSLAKTLLLFAAPEYFEVFVGHIPLSRCTIAERPRLNIFDPVNNQQRNGPRYIAVRDLRNDILQRSWHRSGLGFIPPGSPGHRMPAYPGGTSVTHGRNAEKSGELGAA